MKDLKSILTQVGDIFATEPFLGQPEGLYQPIAYTMGLGGKRLRPTLLLAASHLFGGDMSRLRNATIAIELFHNFTLLHDDLMDQSPLRRGQPTVYRKWNPNVAILSGDAMCALAWRYMLRYDQNRKDQALECFNETTIGVYEGQQLDMEFEQRNDVIIAEYMTMIRQKTAVLLAGALKIGALSTTAADEEIARLYDFGIHLGLAFQLQDDLLDTYGDTAVLGKQTAQDIADNKKNYLYLRALSEADAAQRDQLLALFATKPQGSEAAEKIERVLAIYNTLGLSAKTNEAIAAEFDEAARCLDAIGVPQPAKLPLMQLTEALFGRKK